MLGPHWWLSALVIASSGLFIIIADARELGRRHLRERQTKAARGWHKRLREGRRATAAATHPRNITFSNPRASEFYVDGTSIPEIDFDVGPSWSGLLPISGDPDETRKLFFWFFPPGPEGSLDDLIFWSNGGPGCSSLEGLLQENGPFSWSFGQAKPTVNQWGWTNLSSVLWVEQPVGTGYSQGTPNLRDENHLAEQLIGFFQQFLEVFRELKGKKFYLSGESYAGTYISYLANYIHDHPEKLDLSLQGIWISDSLLSWRILQTQVPAVDFVRKYKNVFALNQTFTRELDALNKMCGYEGYYEKWVTFPPKPGPFPLPGNGAHVEDKCDIWNLIFEAALIINPAFNYYRIFDTYPTLWDVLGYPGPFPEVQAPIYFDREDVKKVLHVPTNSKWVECGAAAAFPDGDRSLPPALTVLPSVIEKNKKTVIVHGVADYILISDGTRIILQNMTWNGQQGFQTPIRDDSFIVEGVGALGTAHSERGLTYFEVALSGHMVPQFSPVAAYQTMEVLMGRREAPPN